MDSYEFLLAIALILLSTKTFGLLSTHVHMPQVVGALLAGIILGPSMLGFVEETDFLLKASEIGVIMLMFLAGLDTDISELKKTGPTAFVIACIGVIVPLAGGFIIYDIFFVDTYTSDVFLRAAFVGVILTATSVSITVETLREMGKLKGPVGTAIMGAAIIDDILGIILLSFMSGFTDPSAKPMMVFVKIGGFFVFLAIIGIIVYWSFQKMEVAFGQKRRIAIYGLAFALILSYIAEKFFGIADITGAYFAGLILCNIANTRQYIAKKVNVASYLMFSPLFFASVGIKTDIHSLTSQYMLFAVVLLIVAVLTKIVGCGLGAKICGMSSRDSLRVGVGMISRGEVALIVADKGMQAGLVDPAISPAIVLVVIATTLMTPILLNIVMKERGKSRIPEKQPYVG
ncbi:cation:proton antiporter [Anaerotignum faecicola]|nr:cation:proton antiporter [Anaerotignum faecicola]